MVKRKSLSAEFLQKVSAEILSVSAETNLSVSVFRQKANISAERSFFCRKELFLPKFGEKAPQFWQKGALISAETPSFCRKKLFLQKKALSAEYRFRQKLHFLYQLLSAFCRKRKNLFRLTTSMNIFQQAGAVPEAVLDGRGEGAALCRGPPVQPTGQAARQKLIEMF